MAGEENGVSIEKGIARSKGDQPQASAGEIWRRLEEEDGEYEWGELGKNELQILRSNRALLRGLLHLT